MSMSKNQKGFTIIELMIATTVFSVILLVASAAIIQIGKVYYKGLISARTQENARYIMENVSRDLQFSNTNGLQRHKDPDKPYTDARAYCIGSNKYTYYLNTQVVSGTHGLILSDATPGDCSPNTNPTDDDREMLGANTRLLRFDIKDLPGGIYEINIAIAYGDSDLLTTHGTPSGEGATASALCKTGVAGSNFCATSMLDTTVKRRIN